MPLRGLPWATASCWAGRSRRSASAIRSGSTSKSTASGASGGCERWAQNHRSARFRATHSPSSATTAITSPNQDRSTNGFTSLVSSGRLLAGVEPSLGVTAGGVGGSKT